MTYDRGNYVEIVGNGDWSTRSNARTLDWNGNEVLSGKLTVGTAPTNNMDVTTKQYVDTGLAGADEIIEITATDYDALSYAEKHNGKYYHITDRNSSNELDTKVTQTQDDSTNATYEVLLAGSTSATTATESAKKSSGLTYNPSTSVLSMSGTPSGNTDVVTKAYADGKVDKTGDTMTGDLNINSNNARTKYINPNMTLDTSANNGLSSDSSYGAYFTDKNGNAVGDVSMTTRSTGRNYAQLMARNKKTDGTAVTNYIDVIADKDGSSSYYVSNPAAFRSAIGLGSETGINGYFEWSTGSVSVPNATRTDVYQKTITVTGVYMVQFIGNWDKKAGGSRVILVAPNTKPQVNGGRRTSNTSFVGTESSLDWFQEHIFFQTLNAGDILYFCAYQNSGSTIAIYPIVNIIRIQ